MYRSKLCVWGYFSRIYETFHVGRFGVCVLFRACLLLRRQPRHPCCITHAKHPTWPAQQVYSSTTTPTLRYHCHIFSRPFPFHRTILNGFTDQMLYSSMVCDHIGPSRSGTSESSCTEPVKPWKPGCSDRKPSELGGHIGLFSLTLETSGQWAKPKAGFGRRPCLFLTCCLLVFVFVFFIHSVHIGGFRFRGVYDV